MEPTKVKKVNILGKETIQIGYDFQTSIVEDLLQNVPSSTYLLVCDYNVYEIIGKYFEKIFNDVATRFEGDVHLLIYTIPPGETSKSRDTKNEIEDWMLSEEREPRLDTKSVIIALGGGVVGDMLGFVAATFNRGIRFVNIPTTLLAMVDSSIGGKTAIDTPAGKNLIGAFWQPSMIYIDLQYLNSLPAREFINGMAEVIKTAAIYNKNKFETLESNSQFLMEAINSPSSDERRLSNVRDRLMDIVVGSAGIKAEVVSSDEREGGLRNILNFGHTIGHAIEGILTPQILHGECVAIGMVLEAELARYLGILEGTAVARLKKCLNDYGLPTSITDPTVQERSGHRYCSVDRLLSVMSVDKKNQNGKKRVVLLQAIGEVHRREATVVKDQNIRVMLSPGIMVLPSLPKSSKVSCTPPGSKSISNRAILIAAFGNGTCRIKNFLQSDDTKVMMDALKQLQAASFSWEEDAGAPILVVTGKGGQIQASDKDLNVGNAGTASRFLTTAVTLAKPGSSDCSIVTGNERMQQRPIGDLVDALKSNGAGINYLGKSRDGEPKTKALPLEIKATEGLEGGEIELRADFSSQFVSSILMCAPYAKKPVTLRLVGGKPISQLYIDLTIAMMKSFGIDVLKSTSEEYTYHIPQGEYQNPSTYEIESDASSATYPLAIAAITGTTCTVPNIGSASLQGDAKFAVDVLKPMGCEVIQNKYSTTVTGPKKGGLRPLSHIDMEPMTDAFLTASVLAAVAQGDDGRSTTKIVGIKNQHKKECDRIEAMETELSKFGVTCRGSEDGIEIDGINYADLKTPHNGVHCYDDHRVAMSFSVLSLVTPKGAMIQERECVGKTWPGWWDTLRGTFNANMEGVDLGPPPQKPKRSEGLQKSIYIIGMRGAGKTTSGKMIADHLNWTFTDLDLLLESEKNQRIPEMIEKSGWEAFREQELAILKGTLQEKPKNHVFACGGGIVETPEARQALINHHETGGLVILVQRDIEDVLAYLEIDKTRPAYVNDMRSVWLKRKDWYIECSNHEYLAQKASSKSLTKASKDLKRFIGAITGQSQPLKQIKAKPNSFFVSLTVPDVAKALTILPEVVVGSDAVELRVDLLEDPKDPGQAPSIDFVTQQLAILQVSTSVPVIFTVRTQGQGGKFPDDAEDEAFALYELGLRMGVDFLDVEIHHPVVRLHTLTARKGNTKIIASHHDPKGTLCWNKNTWIPHYRRALLHGDIVKLVGVATCRQDNYGLPSFRDWAHLQSDIPVIAINMGRHGQLSRAENDFLTPVSHPALPFKAAPGQLSAAEIRVLLTGCGYIEPKHYYLFGKPIALSKSPAMHNGCFKAAGLPHSYNLRETDSVQDLKEMLLADDFGGASVTIPLKIDIMPFLHEITEDARTIGAVNTIVAHPTKHTKEGHPHLTGSNTDWQGMVKVLETAGAEPSDDHQSGLVIGGGGTARAAIYALHVMKYFPIYIIGRSPNKIEELIRSFPRDWMLKSLSKAEEVKSISTPNVAIGAIPGDRPVDDNIRSVLKHIFAQKKGILLEMAYKPAVTDLMKLAHPHSWHTIPGSEVLAAQGYYQSIAWTGITPSFETLRKACEVPSS